MQVKNIAILLTVIKLPVVIKIFVLSIFEWLFYTGFTVLNKNETVLFSIQNICINSGEKMIIFILENFVYLDLCACHACCR